MTDPTSEPASEGPALADTVRALHGRYPTGVTVVTVAGSDGASHGLAVNAFSSISLDPPLVMVAVNATSSSYPWLFTADHLAVNVIADTQSSVVRAFARSGGDKFSGVIWHPGATGAPLIDGVTGYFELGIRYKIPAYTHTIFIGEVLAAAHSDRAALIYLGGGFYAGDDLRPAG